jgi:hypothetical protein
MVKTPKSKFDNITPSSSTPMVVCGLKPLISNWTDVEGRDIGELERSSANNLRRSALKKASVLTC